MIIICIYTYSYNCSLTSFDSHGFGILQDYTDH